MAFTEDFSEFIDTDDFAVEASISSQFVTESGTAVLITESGERLIGDVGTFNCIYQASYAHQIEGEYTVGVESTRPMIIVADEDIVNLEHDDIINVNGSDHYVSSIQPDGTGTSEIYLELING